MQKCANLRGWRLAAGLNFAAALLLLVSITGLDTGADMIGSSGPGLGVTPREGLRGAEDGDHLVAGHGPAEHGAASEVGRGFSDIAHQREKHGQVIRQGNAASRFIRCMAQDQIKRPEIPAS